MESRLFVTEEQGRKSEVVLNIGNPAAYTVGQWQQAYGKEMIEMLINTVLSYRLSIIQLE